MFYFIAMVAFFMLISVLAWTLPDLSTEPAGTATSADTSATQRGESPASGPESIEGALAAQLVAGEISPGQYRRAIERLAARDEERHHLAAPPEIGPADA